MAEGCQKADLIEKIKPKQLKEYYTEFRTEDFELLCPPWLDPMVKPKDFTKAANLIP